MHPAEHEKRLEPLYVSLKDAETISGLSAVTLYRRIADGKIICRKAGSKTLVELKSLRGFLESLPRFIGTTGQNAA